MTVLSCSGAWHGRSRKSITVSGFCLWCFGSRAISRILGCFRDGGQGCFCRSTGCAVLSYWGASILAPAVRGRGIQGLLLCEVSGHCREEGRGAGVLADIGAPLCGSSHLASERLSAACRRTAAVCSSQALGLLTMQPGAERSCPVVFSFPRGKYKSSAGNLKDPFFSSFFLPPGELADILG